MKVTRLLAGIARSILFFSILVFAAPHTIHAAGVVTNCTEADLRAAMTGGGTVTFACDGTITVASQVSITTNTTLDATGHNVILSGGNAVRLFDITPGTSLTLMNLTIAHGRNQGFNGAAGADGGQGSGGAINVDNGTLNLIGCRIWTNTAAGGAGGNGSPEGGGGPAVGGAIYVNHSTLNATNSEFVGNLAIGGPGGATVGPATPIRSGGQAWGGAIASSGGLLQLDNCSFTSNAAIGGRAPEGISGNAGTSGGASGGVWFNDGGTAVVARCSFLFNTGSTPKPSVSTVGHGGTVRGGSICNVSGALSILGTEFIGNRVSGGAAVRYGKAGPGLGGAIYNLAILDLSRCLIKNNSAYGGDDGSPGVNGQGGAIYNGGQLKITQTEFQTNTVQAGQGYEGGIVLSASGIAQGGAVFTTNVLVLSESTLSGNVAYGAVGGQNGNAGPFPGYPAYGGAIYSSGTSFLTNNTLTANVASGGNSPITGGGAYGGGFYQTNGTAFLLNNTLAGNSGQGGTGNPAGGSYGGGIANQSGAVALLNTVVANSSSGSNSFGTLTDAGHNLSSDTSCNFTNTGSLNNADPKLGPLADYGGLTPTMPLLTGSPAIDGGDSSFFPPTDQRGRARPYGAAPDIGAFESSPPFVIRGSVSGATFKEEVLLTAGLSSAFTSNGNYALGLSPSAYSVAPQSSNYLFIPPNRPVSVGPDQLGVNFKAYRWNALSLDDVTNGALHLVFAGTNGVSYRLLGSTNFSQWSPVSTNTVGPASYFEVFVLMTSRLQFFRTVTP